MKHKKRYWLLLIVLLVGVGVACGGAAGRRAQITLQTATVTSMTATDTVESSGTIEPLQSATLNWKTGGIISEILVSEGQQVQAGDPLARLDLSSVSQNIIAAQADLINAQNSLDTLLNPSELTLARAEKNIADAQVALEQAQLRANGGFGSPAEQQQAQALLNLSQLQLEDAQQKLEDLNGQSDPDPLLVAQAEKAVADGQVNVAQAQQRLNGNFSTEAEANQAQLNVTVAELALADAQAAYDKLLNPDPNDVLALQVRLAAIQSTLDATVIVAPFDGQVVSLLAQVGDVVQAGAPAGTLANRTKLQITAAIDESDIGQIHLDDVVNLTLRSLDDLALPGRVEWISPVSTLSQGLVRYDVRIVLSESEPLVRLGMTADLEIVTHIEENALAVPLDAVQLDSEGEFVNRLRPDNTTERVPVNSGQINGDLVVVIGDLSVGDIVQLVVPQPTSSGSGPFGN